MRQLNALGQAIALEAFFQTARAAWLATIPRAYRPYAKDERLLFAHWFRAMATKRVGTDAGV
jgi:hypothetical protein